MASLHLEYAPNLPVKTTSLVGTIKLVKDVVTGIGLERLQRKTREEETRRGCRNSEPPRAESLGLKTE